MTKGSKDYANAKIYKLEDDEGYFYIGHTCLRLTQRLSYHKQTATQKQSRRVYEHYNKVGWGRVRIVLICDDLNVANMEQLLREEDGHIKMHINDEKCLNVRRPQVPNDEKRAHKKQYREENAEAVKRWAIAYKEKNPNYHKEYCKEHKDSIAAQRKQHYEDNKPEIRMAQKRYNEENKEVINTRKMEYYKRHRESIAQRNSEKVECSNCGFLSARCNLPRHKQSTKCRSISDAKTV